MTVLSAKAQARLDSLLRKGLGYRSAVALADRVTDADAAGLMPLPANPTDGQVATWSASSSLWVPSSLPGVELDNAVKTDIQQSTLVSTWVDVAGLTIAPTQQTRPVHIALTMKMTSSAIGGFGVGIVDSTGVTTYWYGFLNVAALVTSVGYLLWTPTVRIPANDPGRTYKVQIFQAQAGTVKAYCETNAPGLFTATRR